MCATAFRVLVCHAFLTVAAAWGATISVVFDSNQFGTIDSASGAYTQISSIPLKEAAGVATGLTSLYVEDVYSDLLSIDPATGIATLVGSSQNLSVTVFGGGSNGLFELDPSSNLYSVSSSTGKATLIGSTGLPGNNFRYDTSLASDGTYLYYTVGSGGSADELYRINTSTAKATDLGSTGVTNVAGSAFVNGRLELFQYGQSTNYIYSAADGSTQFTRGPALSAQIIDGGAVFCDGALNSQVSSSTPEPGTFLTGLSGVALLMIGWTVGEKRRL